MDGNIGCAVPPSELFYGGIAGHIHFAARLHAEYIVAVVLAVAHGNVGYGGCGERSLFVEFSCEGVYGQFAVLDAAAGQRECLPAPIAHKQHGLAARYDGSGAAAQRRVGGVGFSAH